LRPRAASPSGHLGLVGALRLFEQASLERAALGLARDRDPLALLAAWRWRLASFAQGERLSLEAVVLLSGEHVPAHRASLRAVATSAIF